MANPTRTPGKRGLLPRDRSRRVPVLEHYLRQWEGPVALRPKGGMPISYGGGGGGRSNADFYGGTLTVTSTLPAAAGNIDRETRVTDWPMYVNGPDPTNPSYAPDGVGDCFWAGSGHMFTAMRVYAGYEQVLFSNDAIITGYRSTGYVPGDDSTDLGTDPAAGLKYLSTAGLTDETGHVHRVGAYAAFGDPRNTNLMAQVLATFGTVGIGFNCTQNFEDAFNSGEPVTYDPSSPAIGGHWVVLQRRSVGGVGVLDEVTWGAVQRVTRAYNWHQVTDAFAIASEDFIQANGTSVQGLDFAQLCEDTQDAE